MSFLAFSITTFFYAIWTKVNNPTGVAAFASSFILINIYKFTHYSLITKVTVGYLYATNSIIYKK